MNTSWWTFGCLSMAAGIGLDSFGYHVLTAAKRTKNPHYRFIWRIGTTYHFATSISILLMAMRNHQKINLINGIFTLGMSLFAGSLYTIVAAKNHKFAIATPIGGTTLIIGWLLAWYFGAT